MTTFNTGNPVGSTAVKDLYDNAQNLDEAVNSQTADVWTDRFGKARKTWRGIERQAQIDVEAAAALATQQAEGFRDEAREARDDANAAAGAIGPLKFYDTYAQAMADVANWPAEGLIEIAQDETHDGARTRYRPNGAALDFVVNLDQLRLDLASVEYGAAGVGFDGEKNYVAGTIGARLKERISVADFPWLASKDKPDNSAAIQAALDTGLDVYIPDWMPVQNTVYLVNDGQLLESSGKFSGGLINTTTSARLFQCGRTPDIPGKRAQFSVVRNIGFRGNSASIEGLRALGILSDGATGAARGVSFENIDVRDIGSGDAMVVNGWCVAARGVTLWSSLRGLALGKEVNACHFDSFYISNMQKEGFTSPNDGGIPAASHFTSLVVQYCCQDGLTDHAIDFRRGYSFVFDSLYLEGNKANVSDVYMNGGIHGTKVRGVNYQIAGSSEYKDVILIEGNAKAVEIHGVLGLQGNVNSLVRVRNGTLPVVTVSGLHMANGVAASGELLDESPRHQVIRIDSANNSFGPTRLFALANQNNLTLLNEAGVVKGFFRDGSIYFGADTESSRLNAAGQLITARFGAQLARLQADRYALGMLGIAIYHGAGDPNGFFTAPPGSLFLRSDGGAGTSLYVKQSGTGSTGWVGK